MARKAEDLSLWLPGFGNDDDQAYPELFTDSKGAVPAVPLPSVEEANTEAPGAIEAQSPRGWRPTGVRAANESVVFWPEWPESAFAGLEGQATKFDANLEAIATLRALEQSARAPTLPERTALVRFTGWGGIPASFNLDGRDAAWQARAEQLRDFLSPAEYEAAKGSVNNSHYTEPLVIRWIWTALQRLGFEGGRVLEPSSGVGHFIGCMPREVATRSRITAIELDAIPGRIVKALYGPAGVDVRIQGLESAALADESFDLVVSNVPFGDYQVSDGRNRPYSRFSIHNWFVGKALDLVRPGGLVCFITSAYFMDARSEAARAHVASQADLVAAFRLPRGTFERLASTDVQSDTVILRKRASTSGPSRADWVDLAFVPDELRHPACHEKWMQVNAWYVRHPQHVLGLIDKVSRGYEAVPTAVLDGELGLALERALPLIPTGVYAPPATTHRRAKAIDAPAGARPGSFVLHEGRIHTVQEGELVDVNDKTNATARQRIRGMCEIRDLARRLLGAQLDDASEGEITSLRQRLNASYDRFVAKHGWLTNRANALAFRRDPDYPLLLSLEHYDDEKEAATKADIFRKRTVARIVEPTRAAEPDEALAHSMQWRGRVDPEYMASLLQAEPADVTSELEGRGLIYRNPDDGDYETADAYLSGNVKRKLQAALAAGPAYAHNVAALEKVIPEDLLPAAIEPRLGAVWIPAEVVEHFMRDVLKLPSTQVRYLAKAGTWSVKVDTWEAGRNVTCSQEFGTARMNAVELVQHALNVQTPTVRDPHPELDTYVVNKPETLAAREKLGMLKERFSAWAYEDAPRRERLCRIYNDLFNCTRPRQFDGSHLKLPGFSRCFDLRAKQRNAIWRIVQSGNTGLFHAVGAGKTAVLVAASMELRRLGLVSKPAHVVPNHLLEQYTAEFVRLYPCAAVLMATKEDLATDRRREFVSRIATGDWDAIVMTHSTFELLAMSVEFTTRHIKAIVHDLEMAVRATKADDRSNRIVKQLERMKKAWKVRLERLQNQPRKDDFLTWESLGIDWLGCDEAHLFKNLWRHTKMSRVAGLPLANSQRAFDLYLKTRYTASLHDGQQRGVVLSTATPVANSMAEIHTFQRYLQPQTLEALGLEQFDAWAATFGETVTALELAPDGSGYRLNTRFARFINVPDLMTVFYEIGDVQTKEMLDLPVPRLKGQKPRTVTCPASAALRDYVRSLVKRAERIKTGQVDPRSDNMLSVTNDGRKAALDLRLIDSASAFDTEGKVAKCAHEVHGIWQRTLVFKGTQLVFCDLSTPKGGKEFSVYEDLRDNLVYRGIPADEIAFVHDADTDAQKARLFRRVREGLVRVLLGSTSKMGVGTNVQKRLVALHELDCPWRPCDVEQREGRILRQGNECEEVEIIRYVTEGSFDAYSWQTVLTKAKFIAQVMSGDKGLRSIDDVELATLSYAEVKALASGNPKVIEKAGVDADIARYSTLFSVWRNQRYANESEVANLPMRIESSARLLAALTADAESAEPLLRGELRATIRGRERSGQDDLGEALRIIMVAARSNSVRSATEELAGKIGRFELCVLIAREFENTHLYLRGEATHDCSPYRTAAALYAEVVKTMKAMELRRSDAETRLAALRRRLEDLRDELAKPFEHEERLTALLMRQRDLASELDLDKDEAGTQGLEATEEAAVA
jgi:N12 class adenine-specific DNA methylase